ncbi:MAG: ComF family protein [Candidatus Magasanikbacteria bacterium]|nr:ComF family protein [Candidatus Magasanikbacteria bacterium]
MCHIERVGGRCCDECRDKTPLARHVAMMPLTSTSLLHQIIHLYKYDYIEGLEFTLQFLISRFLETYQFSSVDYIVPVPLHKKRYVERGFNQSERIARILSAETGIACIEPLKRITNTLKQATLDRSHREVNVLNAFVVQKDCVEIISGKNIVLVDDVYTTGSTLRECASALKTAGVQEISGWSIARG